MMNKVIAYRNFPIRYPVVSSAVAYLLLDKFNSPGWLWGMVITLFAILWIATIAVRCKQRQVDISEVLDAESLKPENRKS